MDNLLNISPIDGRYREKTEVLGNYLSEYALIKYRIIVEVKWLLFLCDNIIIKEKISSEDKDKILSILGNFDLEEAKSVKEKESVTKHDVKAVEYYLQDKFRELGLERLIPFIHITCTSEDINNTSYNLMVNDALKYVYYPNIYDLISKIDEYADRYKNIPMLGHTHGQVATPTTVGKEFKVFSYRMISILDRIDNIKLRSKFSGATGNYNCHVVAYPDVDWIKTSKEFIESLGLEYNPLTTQIESHDILCSLLSDIKIMNNIIKDFNSDMWLYISRNYFVEKAKKGEVGSSVMPHKVNPINHENSMANNEMSSAMIDGLVNNLSISRMQRDLSDSSKLRNLGVVFAHSILSMKETLVGLNKLEVNESVVLEDLDNHYEVLSEAIQTVLRKNGCSNAYERLKELSRGKKVTKEDIINFVNDLDIPEEDKERLLNLTPATYIGLCSEIVDNNKRMILKR